MDMGASSAGADPVLDLAFLEQYTGGDVAIRDEVLRMFVTQANVLLEKLGEAGADEKSWREVAHSLKGCARGVGANAIADLAKDAEANPAMPTEAQAQLIADLRLHIDQAEAFVSSIVSG